MPASPPRPAPGPGPEPDGGVRRVEAVFGDITTEQVDAVVNAANGALAMGAGVCGAIFRAAGADDLRVACAGLGGCEPGDAKAAPGFRLPARWIVHAVGPVWRGGGEGEDEILASCYRRSLAVAGGLGARSVAFPAIATGIYGFPLERAARIAVDTVRAPAPPPATGTPSHADTSADTDAGAGVALVRLVAFDRATFERYRQLLA